MRRFNFTSYITPRDPKRQRTEHYGKIRTEETTPHVIALEYLAGFPDAVLLNVEGRIDSDSLSQNKLQLTYSFESPFPGTAVVEMQEVEEAATHPLTQAGFIAWAEDRVSVEPTVDGKPNSVELELARVLHERMVEAMYDEKSSDLRVWLSDILWSGQRGYAELPRAELLSQLQADFIDGADESIETVEDALE